MPEVPPNDNNCETEGVTPTLTGVIGTLQANEILNKNYHKIILIQMVL